MSPLQDDTYSDPTQYVAGGMSEDNHSYHHHHHIRIIVMNMIIYSNSKPIQSQDRSTVTVTTWETVPCRKQLGWSADLPGLIQNIHLSEMRRSAKASLTINLKTRGQH